MDKPVLFFLTVLAVFLFASGAAAVLMAKGKTGRILGGIALIGAATFIAYGLDTYCLDADIYARCGG